MELTWESLTKLFTWAAQHGSEAPLADTAAEAIVIDFRFLHRIVCTPKRSTYQLTPA